MGYKTKVWIDFSATSVLYCVNPNTYGFGFSNYVNAEQKFFLIKNLKTFGENGRYLEGRLNYEISCFFETLKPGTAIPIRYLFTHTVLNSVWGIVMGYTFKQGDPQMEILCDLAERVTAIEGMVESVGMFNPWLSNLMPDFTGVTSWIQAYRGLCDFVEGKANDRKQTRVKGQPRDITDAYIDRVEDTKDPASTFFPAKKFFPHSMAAVLVGALDTTSTALEWIIFYLAKYQDVQRKLQQEILEVASKTGQPALSDRPNLPYTEAVIHEVLRITGLVPMALPHYTSVDAEVSGYFIPKDTLLIQNTWGIQHDPEVWDEPEEFRPERFLDENRKFRKNENLLIFGTGKRSCLGESIARDQLSLFVARMFQRFSVQYSGKPPSEHGKHGVVIHAEPFSAIFTEI
ncbi:unnamed protein product [Allacma fusca]|uniref:Cytochrome P450 n=1 Tax=Allacma fusca TaxID=39272 RepID=A0A8J2JEU3_9HEXA|nr:unnamed protein product [Allacma fusca]